MKELSKKDLTRWEPREYKPQNNSPLDLSIGQSVVSCIGHRIVRGVMFGRSLDSLTYQLLVSPANWGGFTMGVKWLCMSSILGETALVVRRVLWNIKYLRGEE